MTLDSSLMRELGILKVEQGESRTFAFSGLLYRRIMSWGHIEEHEGALIILEVLTESLVDTFFGHNRPVT